MCINAYLLIAAIHRYSYKLAMCVCNYSIVDGGWGFWVIGPCSRTCGGGIRGITRKCNNPEPFCNGKQCEGNSYLAFPGKCNDKCCPGKNMNIVAHLCMYTTGTRN